MNINRSQYFDLGSTPPAIAHGHALPSGEGRVVSIRVATEPRNPSAMAISCALIAGFIFICSILLLPLNAQAEELWPSIRLPVPERMVDRQYLGLSKGDTFSLAQINARIIVVQIYSMYCPICQREATRVNSLYKMVSARKDISGKAKILAIGAGNSDFEVQFYRSTYEVPFPLFADGDFKLHRELGEVGTPYYYILRKDPKGVFRQVYAKAGAFDSPERFLDLILERLK